MRFELADSIEWKTFPKICYDIELYQMVRLRFWMSTSVKYLFIPITPNPTLNWSSIACKEPIN